MNAKRDENEEQTEGSEPEDEIRQEMRRLSETSESRRAQVFQTNTQLKKAHLSLKELKQAIKLKVGRICNVFHFRVSFESILAGGVYL